MHNYGKITDAIMDISCGMHTDILKQHHDTMSMLHMHMHMPHAHAQHAHVTCCNMYM